YAHAERDAPARSRGQREQHAGTGQRRQPAGEQQEACRERPWLPLLVAVTAPRDGAECRRQRGREPGAREPPAAARPELLHRPPGHLPVPDLEEAPWRNPMWERSASSRGTSRPPGGWTATASSSRSRRTRRCYS